MTHITLNLNQMGYCRVLFVLDDGTEIEGIDKTSKILHLFPFGIIEKTKPLFYDAMNKTEGWNSSIFRVYQNGKTETELNIPPDIPFNLDLT